MVTGESTSALPSDAAETKTSGWRRRTARAAAALVLSIPALAACIPGGGTQSAGTAPEGAPTVAATTVSPSAAPSPSKETFPEIADHNPVLQLWANNRGKPANGSLPLGTVVQVECLAPNLSGVPSADPGFYRFPWGGQEVYGISNEFANGDPVGVNGYNTVVDPNVPPC